MLLPWEQERVVYNSEITNAGVCERERERGEERRDERKGRDADANHLHVKGTVQNIFFSFIFTSVVCL